MNFSVYGNWKKQGETRIGWHIQINSNGTFEVSGSASQMKWTLVSSVTTYQSTSSPDTNHSTLLQNMFGLSSSDYSVKEMTFVPY